MDGPDLFSSDESEMADAFFSDGYQIAKDLVGTEISTKSLYLGIKKLYSAIDNFMELFLETASQGGVSSSCTQGCSWCCYQAVYAESHEFDFLKNWLKMNLRTEALNKVREESKKKYNLTSKLSKEKRAQYKHSCPLLVNNECSAYAARPIACRIYTSFDLKSCEYEYLHPEDKDHYPQVFDFPFQAGRKMNEGFAHCLKEKGKEIQELSIEEGLIKTDGEIII
jgi:Fe-S-cluster containining protein